MASIREIAERAGVAPGTVSRALNNKGYISAETREKIDAALKELEYVPNQLARNLYRRRSNMAGVVLPDVDSPFFTAVIKHLVKELNRFDYHVVLCSTDYRRSLEEEYLDMLRANVMDGLIVAVPLLPGETYAALKRPVVMLDREMEGVPCVRVNHEKSGLLAAEKFLSDGCRYVLSVSGEKSADIPSYQRFVSFGRRMEQAGAHAEPVELAWTRFDFDYYLAAAEELFARYPQADGIYTADILATACLKAAIRRGIRVPENFEIISCDGVYGADYGVYSLSSVVQSVETIARQAASILMNAIEGRPPAAPEVADVFFREGDTTKPHA